MKQWLPVLCLSFGLSACTPGFSPDVGGAASRAANRAVESAVDTLISRTVERIVNNIFDTLIASAIDGIFGFDGEIVYGPNFALELYTGSYELTISGDTAVTGRFEAEASEPNSDDEDVNLAVGVRGENDEGQDFIGVSLIHTEDGDDVSFVITLIDVEAENGERVRQAGFQDANTDVSYVGEMVLDIEESEPTRLVGSFSAPALLSDVAAGSVSIQGSFDVPINPAGSLFIQALDDK